MECVLTGLLVVLVYSLIWSLFNDTIKNNLPLSCGIYNVPSSLAVDLYLQYLNIMIMRQAKS